MKATTKIRIENGYKFYVHTDLDELIDVSNTALMNDYVKQDLTPPCLDVLLDWRIKVSFLISRSSGTTKGLYKNEMNAVDFLLNEHYN